MFVLGLVGIFKFFLSGFETIAGFCDFLGLRSRGCGSIGQDTVVNESLAEVAELFVYEGAD